jgi:putative PIN family toxin of toxin-antitoxin system
MIRVVLDTNVIVSAHLNEEGLEASLLTLALAGKIELCVSEAILAEYEGVLRRKKFSLSPRRITHSLSRIRKASLLVQPS